MASDHLSLGKAFAVLLGVSSPVIIYGGYQAYRTGLLASGWRRLHAWAFGGVTALALGCTSGRSDLEDPLMPPPPSPSASSSGSQESPVPVSTMATGEESPPQPSP